MEIAYSIVAKAMNLDRKGMKFLDWFPVLTSFSHYMVQTSIEMHSNAQTAAYTTASTEVE